MTLARMSLARRSLLAAAAVAFGTRHLASAASPSTLRVGLLRFGTRWRPTSPSRR
jgi:hypothetical protein